MTFIVFADGCGRSITVMSSNLIGRNQRTPVENLLKLFLSFNGALLAIFAIPLVFFQTPVLDLAVKVNEGLSLLRSEMSFSNDINVANFIS